MTPGPMSSSGLVEVTGNIPAHLLELLEEWHKVHPTEPAPPCYHLKSKIRVKLLATTKFFSREFKEIPSCIEITVEKPVRYKTLWLPVPNGDKSGVIVKNWSWGSRRSFLKKWRGGYDFQDEPIAVRQSKRPDGSFGEAPTEEVWVEVTKRTLQSLSTRTPQSSSNTKRRRIESDDEQSTSSGEDTPASSGPSKQLRQSMQRASSSSEPDSESGSEGAQMTRVCSEVRSSNRIRGQVPEIENPAGILEYMPQHDGTRPSSQAPTQPPRQPDIGTLTPLTTTGSIKMTSSIRFRLVVPRTKMVRDLRVEDEEDTPEHLFNQTKDFFRRYDRLIGTPVLECVIEGAMECRCIYNAKELGYFLEELRERGEPVKVTVTHNA
ncbi:hypothetical protein PISL3812_00160 [Talaromyces islandicus]|uniref:Uncharacterized protein n=1 Tax=Talaromyces islandicus TaxID=28573 RepID=A0A0U1LIH4_TALIS|nr:hypothetical protein PISL3812_00160 [Talaromyces islandicus]